MSFILLTEFNHSRQGVLGSDAVYCCGRIPTFRRSMLPPS